MSIGCSTSSVKKLNVLLQRPNAFTGAQTDQASWKEEFSQESQLQKPFNPLVQHWNQEFNFYQPVIEQRIDTQAMDKMMGQTENWNLEFKNIQQEQGHQGENWQTEFLKKQDNQNWESEFSKVLQESSTNQKPISQNEVAQTASSIVDVLKGHDKLKNSSFMDFVTKLQNHDLVIEKNKIVTPIEPFQEAKGLVGNQLKQTSWEEEFSAMKPNHKEWSKEFSEHNTEQKQSWTTEFNRNRQWKHEFLNQIQHENQNFNQNEDQGFDQEFWDYNGKTHKDWINEFDQEIKNLKIGEYLDPLMEQMDKNLDLPKNNLDTYAFSPFNPYLKQTPKELSDFLENSSLNHVSSERILRLEALLQQSSANSNSSLWHQLGMAQQENENDIYAIAALKNAVSLNPKQLESWLLLSASYTNENFKAEGCWALESWFMNHPEYSQIPAPKVEPTMSLSERQNLLLNKYLNAVRSSTFIDADIQIGMGVLLTMRNDYEKAIDCFNAALSLRPNEYILWNKLGATFANSNKSAEAVRSYHRALEINPTYIRARCNLAIACIQLSQYKEAAENLVTALSIQSEISSKVPNNYPTAGVQSATVWSTLKMVVDGYLNRPDLKDACERRDILALRRLF